MRTDSPSISQLQPHGPPQNGYSDMNNSLFSDAEQKQLQTFLDGLDKDDDMDSPPNNEAFRRPSRPPSESTHFHRRKYTWAFLNQSVLLDSPTPVLLSSPFNQNATYSQQQIRPLPVTDHTHSKKRRTGSDKSKQDQRKYRGIETDDNSSRPRKLSGSSSTSSATDHSRNTKEDSAVASRPGRGRKPPHELLTEEQKKANHIASEQKRRANIRIGFDQLVDIVPSLSHCHRSESLILQKCK
ncbi:uncharacterized protein BYT42DRAFT_161910 [Radiomyces spectabilis]|uniref:uncharacterized protein n=1 Tax=Radiomyces spectabilis TaxID=64574 RepID=UPI00221E9208|nr:uncharacterized protein BYT42DRAFT_161910 [Radiomyces spectabilis]KAI8365383.1 hypothetical protein BYT42DRAFT_161910 [Radiomyces spectabilis]